LKKLYVYLYDF